MSLSDISTDVCVKNIILVISEVLRRCEDETTKLESSLLAWSTHSLPQSTGLIKELQALDLLIQLQTDALELSRLLINRSNEPIGLDTTKYERQTIYEVCKLGEVRALFESRSGNLINGGTAEDVTDDFELIIFGK